MGWLDGIEISVGTSYIIGFYDQFYWAGLFTEKLPLVLNEQPRSFGNGNGNNGFGNNLNQAQTTSGNNFPGSKIPVKVSHGIHPPAFAINLY